MLKHAKLLNIDEIAMESESLPFLETVFADLKLNELILAMGNNDKNIQEACRNVFESPCRNGANLMYRQEGVKDALQHPKAVISLYNTLSEMLTNLSNYRYNNRNIENALDPIDYISYRVHCCDIVVSGIEALKQTVSKYYVRFTSKNFKSFCDEFLEEYDERFNDYIHERLKGIENLSIGTEIMISGCIGTGLKLDHFLVNDVLEYRSKHKFDLVDSLFSSVVKKDELQIPHSETKLISECQELRNAGIRYYAECFAKITDELLDYIYNLRNQLAFYFGCINLYASLSNIQCPTCFPDVSDTERIGILADDLYDVHTALENLKTPTASSLVKENASLSLISGTTDSGKTTFLRSIGVAQMMAQAGMFVPAKSMTTGVFRGIFTLFSSETDLRMDGNHLEIELGKLSRMIDCMETHSLILLDEVFSSPSEKESVLIADDVMKAFLDNHITCFFVTHLYTFAKKLISENSEDTSYMISEREEYGKRTYRMVAGEPQETGYGMELFLEIMA